MNKILIISMLIMLLLCTGCNNSDTTLIEHKESLSEINVKEIEYESNAYISFIEPGDSTYLYTKNGYSIMYENQTYLFPSDSIKEERDNFVIKQEELFDFLQLQGIHIGEYTIYVLSDYTNRVESNKNAAFFDIRKIESFEQILTTLQLIYGQFTTYGILYPMAQDIALQLGWNTDDIYFDIQVDKTELISFMKENPIYMELVYPCFVEDYSIKEAIIYSKFLSMELYKHIKQDSNCYSYSSTQLIDCFRDAAEQFISENNIDYKFKGEYGYSYSGSSYPLSIQTEFIDIKVRAGYKDDFEQWFTNHSMSSYRDIVLYMDEISEDMKYVRGLLSYTNPKKVDVNFELSTILQGKGSNMKLGGVYENTKITLATAHVLLHEYVHFIYAMNSKNNTLWASELLAFYYQKTSLLNMKYFYPNQLEDIKEGYDNGESDYIRNIVDFVDNNMTELEDAQKARAYFIVASDLDAYERKMWSWNIINYYDSLYSSFGNYLVITYGVETFNKMLLSEDMKTFTGKNLNELMKDWGDYLHNTYSYLYEENESD